MVFAAKQKYICTHIFTVSVKSVENTWSLVEKLLGLVG
jgi:hypothetical protein